MNKDDRAILEANTQAIRDLTLALTCNPTDDEFMEGRRVGLLWEVINSYGNNTQALLLQQDKLHLERNQWRLEEIERYENKANKGTGKIVAYALTRVSLDIVVIALLIWIIFGLNI